MENYETGHGVANMVKEVHTISGNVWFYFQFVTTWKPVPEHSLASFDTARLLGL